MLLAAADPDIWLARHFAGFFRPHLDAVAEGQRHTVLTLSQLLADDAAELRRVHARLVAEGSPAPAAATYLSGWFGGIAGAVIGYAYAASGAGFVADPAAIAFHFHPEGWTDRVELTPPAAVLVDAAHPWAGLPGVTVAEPAEIEARVLAGLIACAGPIIDALMGLAKVKKVSLWYELVDGISSALVYQKQVPVTPEAAARIQALCHTPDMPWARKPHVERVETWHGPVCVMQKAGCCLAYTEPPHDHDDHDEDENHRLFHALFTDPPGKPDYCANCRLRDRDDCTTRQLWWREREYLELNPR